MSMRELLRIEMSAAQVKEACEQWAYARSLVGVESDATVTVDAGTGCAAVVFSKKRAPRARKAPVYMQTLQGSATTLSASTLPASTQVEIERFYKGDRQ